MVQEVNKRLDETALLFASGLLKEAEMLMKVFAYQKRLWPRHSHLTRTECISVHCIKQGSKAIYGQNVLVLREKAGQ